MRHTLHANSTYAQPAVGMSCSANMLTIESRQRVDNQRTGSQWWRRTTRASSADRVDARVLEPKGTRCNGEYKHTHISTEGMTHCLHSLPTGRLPFRQNANTYKHRHAVAKKERKGVGKASCRRIHIVQLEEGRARH